MMGIFSTSHMLFIGLIALLMFGNRLPSVMRSLGEGVSEFKRGLDDINREVTKESPRSSSGGSSTAEKV
jgi:sec-independent protein translocase protein TatA